MSTPGELPKRRPGQRGPDRKPRKGSPRVGRKGTTQRDESPGRAVRAKALDLLTEGRTVAEVAEEIGKPKQTVYRWLENEAFAAELDRRIAGARARAKRILEANAEAAAASLANVAKNGEASHGPRVSAARDILDRIGLAPAREVKLDVTSNPSAGKSDEELERDVLKAAEALGATKP